MAHRLGDINKLIVKSAPSGMSNKSFYIARQSFPSGVIPKHLEGYANQLASAASACSATVRGMAPGPEKVVALRGCVAQKLRK